MKDFTFGATSRGGAWKKCKYCGKEFFVNDLDKWAYKRYSRSDENSSRMYFHTWSCLRKFDADKEAKKKTKVKAEHYCAECRYYVYDPTIGAKTCSREVTLYAFEDRPACRRWEKR